MYMHLHGQFSSALLYLAGSDSALIEPWDRVQPAFGVHTPLDLGGVVCKLKHCPGALKHCPGSLPFEV